MSTRRTAENAAAILLVVGLIFLFSLTLLASRQFDAMETQSKLADQSRARLVALQSVYRALLRAESGQRGFLLTTKQSYLDSYLQGVTDSGTGLKQITTESDDSPAEQSKIALLRSLAQQKLDELNRTVKLQAEHHEAEAIAIVRTDEGERIMLQIQQISGDLITGEREQVVRRNAANRAARAFTERLFWTGEASLALLFAGLFLFIGRSLISQKRMTEALRESEQQVKDKERHLHAITANVPAIIAEYDLNHRCVYINEEVRRVYGVNPTALIGKTQEQIRGHEIFAEVVTELDAVLGGSNCHFEARADIRGKDRHLQQTLVPKRDASGIVEGYYSMTIDITERKGAELKQAENERRLRAIADNLPAFIGYVDNTETYRFLNAHYKSLVSGDPQSFLGRTMKEMLGAETRKALEGHIRGALNGKHQRFEQDGTPLGLNAYYQTDYVPDINEQGRVLGFYILSMDITSRRQAEVRLAEKEHMLTTITDNLPVLISYTDSNEIVRFGNSTYEKWLNIDVVAAVGRQLVDVIGFKTYEARQDQIRRAFSGEHVEFQDVLETDGNLRHLQISYIPDMRGDGTVAGVFALSTDISAMKLAERRLDELARMDALTGLPNRRHFEEKLHDHLLRMGREAHPFAVMILDVDYFKTINDTFGHAVGDTVLKEFSARLQASVRATDIAARLAGDEFIILLPGLHARSEAGLIAEKIVRSMQTLFAVQGQHQVTTSIGVVYTNQISASAEELFACADKALYKAKHNGRNGFAVLDLNIVGIADKRKLRA